MITSIYNSPSFEGGVKVNLEYVLKNRTNIVPQRVLKNVKEAAAAGRETSLKQIHLDTYAPMNACKTLDEIVKLFPEFDCVTPLGETRKVRTLEKIFSKMSKEEFTVELLKKLWANLETFPKLTKNFGLNHRGTLERLAKLLNIPERKSSYLTLVNSSDEAGRAVIAGKTTAWNKAHPTEMLEHNKRASQALKTPKNREKTSKRMQEYVKKHPERYWSSDYMQEVWSKCPNIKKAMKEAFEECNYMTAIVKKEKAKIPLTPAEQKLKGVFYKTFWNKHPELLGEYKRAFAKVNS